MAVIPITSVRLKEDVRDVLVADGATVTTDLKSYFLPSAVKNILSKRKPVPLATRKCHDFDSSKPNYYAGWWKGTDGLCGLNIPSTNVMVSGSSEDLVWSYLPPTGGTSAPFRMSDFRGYATTSEVTTDLFVLNAPSAVLVDGSSTASGTLVVNSVSDSMLGLWDIFDSIHVSAQTANGSYVNTKTFSTVAGTYNLTYTQTELTQMGVVEGSSVRFHVYGMKNNMVRSLRYKESVQTLRTVTAQGALPFIVQIAVREAVRQDSETIVIGATRITFDARNLSGGSVPTSVLQIYPYYGDDVSSYEDKELLGIQIISSVTVQAGRTFVVQPYTTLTVYDFDGLTLGTNKLMFIYVEPVPATGAVRTLASAVVNIT